jgi:hypothetical protein
MTQPVPRASGRRSNARRIDDRYRSDRDLLVTSMRMPVMSTIPAPAIAITSTSDPERPVSETGVVDVGGEVTPATSETGGVDVGGEVTPATSPAATSMLAVRTRTDPDVSVPLALSV